MGRMVFVWIAVAVSFCFASYGHACQIVCTENAQKVGLILCDPQPGKVYSLMLSFEREGKYDDLTLIDEVGCNVDAEDGRIVDCWNKDTSTVRTVSTEVIETRTASLNSNGTRVNSLNRKLRFRIQSNEIDKLPKEIRGDLYRTLWLDFDLSDCNAKKPEAKKP
jgi:hypothetical protein